MSISIICSRCNTPYNLPVNMAGKTVVCKKCKALLDIPGAGAAPPRAVLPSMVASGNARYNHIVGKPAPILFDILGLYTQWQSESVWRDVVRLVWSFHYLVLLIVLIVMWTLYAQTPQSAVMAAPFFLIAAILVLLVAWLQISSIGRSIAQDIGAGKRDAPAVLPYLLSSFVLIVTEPRAALPALRTAFLAIMTLIAALSLASEGGSWTYVVPITSLPSFSTPPASKATAPPPPTSSVKPPETPPATAPTPPSPPPAPPEEKPLPPPEDNNPLPPP